MVYCSSSHSHYILQEFSPYATSVYTVVVLCFLIPLCAKLDFIYLSLKHSACDCLCVKTKLSQCACISEYYCNIVLCALFKYNFYWFSFPTSCCTTWQQCCSLLKLLQQPQQRQQYEIMKLTQGLWWEIRIAKTKWK